MAFNRMYVNKELWPRLILKRLSVSLTHPYHCNKCPQRFHKFYEATAHYLSYHQNSNDLKKSYLCSICQAAFKKRHTLKKHISVVHEKEKPHLCNECGKSFGFANNLKSHIQSVLENKLMFECTQCD